MLNKKKIAERLNEVAMSYGSKTNFAKALGLIPQNLQDYFSGKTTPGFKLLERMRQAGVDTNYIMFGSLHQNEAKEEEKFDRDKYLRSLNEEELELVKDDLRKLKKLYSDVIEHLQEAKIRRESDDWLIVDFERKKESTERLKLFIKLYYDNNISAFARAMGVSRQTLSGYLNTEQSIGNKLLEKIEQAGVNIVWLEYGVGPARNKKPIELEEFKVVDSTEYVKVPNLRSLTKEQLIALSQNVKEVLREQNETKTK